MILGVIVMSLGAMMASNDKTVGWLVMLAGYILATLPIGG